MKPMLMRAKYLVDAVPFSLAYVRIGAAVGALVLFGAVQITMVAYGIWRGERPRPLAWVGLAIASSGLAALTLRSAARPDPCGPPPACAVSRCAGCPPCRGP